MRDVIIAIKELILVCYQCKDHQRTSEVCDIWENLIKRFPTEFESKEFDFLLISLVRAEAFRLQDEPENVLKELSVACEVIRAYPHLKAHPNYLGVFSSILVLAASIQSNVQIFLNRLLGPLFSREISQDEIPENNQSILCRYNFFHLRPSAELLVKNLGVEIPVYPELSEEGIVDESLAISRSSSSGVSSPGNA